MAELFSQDTPPLASNPLFSPQMLILFTMVILVGMGEKISERFLPLYLIVIGGGA